MWDGTEQLGFGVRLWDFHGQRHLGELQALLLFLLLLLPLFFLLLIFLSEAAPGKAACKPITAGTGNSKTMRGAWIFTGLVGSPVRKPAHGSGIPALLTGAGRAPACRVCLRAQAGQSCARRGHPCRWAGRCFDRWSLLLGISIPWRSQLRPHLQWGSCPLLHEHL